MMYIPSLPPGPGPGRVALPVEGSRDRGIALGIICAELCFTTGSLRRKDFRLGLPTRSRSRDTGKQAYRTSLGLALARVNSSNLRFCVASLLHSSSSTTRNHKGDWRCSEPQESRVKSQDREILRATLGRCLSQTGLCVLVVPCPVSEDGGRRACQ